MIEQFLNNIEESPGTSEIFADSSISGSTSLLVEKLINTAQIDWYH